MMMTKKKIFIELNGEKFLAVLQTQNGAKRTSLNKIVYKINFTY